MCTENSILIDYIRLTSAAMIALLSFFLTLFASPKGDRLFCIQMAKNREFLVRIGNSNFDLVSAPHLGR